MDRDGLVLYLIVKGGVTFLFALAAMVISFRQSSSFGRRGYWLWLLVAIGGVLAAPFFYMGITSYRVSYQDALMLREIHAGSWKVAAAYGLLFGVVGGGLWNWAICRT